MARPRNDNLPRYLEFNKLNRAFYYKSPSMDARSNLGTDRTHAVELAAKMNELYEAEQRANSLRKLAKIKVRGVRFADGLQDFVHKYSSDYRLKSTTIKLLQQRCNRLVGTLGDVKLPLIDTPMLRRAIAPLSEFEQPKPGPCSRDSSGTQSRPVHFQPI